MSYEGISTLLAENPCTHPSIIGFQRAPLVVTMNAEPNPHHDYALDFPPRSDGVGLSLYKEGNMTCFARLLRDADFGINAPPDEGDTVETIDGKVVGKLGYEGIRQILAGNGGKSPCTVGFRRKSKQLPPQGSPPGTTKRVGENEYELHLPVTTTTLGIRIRAKDDQVILEQMHRDLDDNSQIQPESGDVIVDIDGTSADTLDYRGMLDFLKQHNGRAKRIIRLRQQHSTTKDVVLGRNGDNGKTPELGVLNPQANLQVEGSIENGFAPNFPEFEVEISMTGRGLGMIVTQHAGKAVFEKFHDFAQVQFVDTVSPTFGDSIVAIDGVPVQDLSYSQIIGILKSPGNRQARHVRFRRKDSVVIP